VSRIAAAVLRGLIRLYRYTLSYFIGGQCRFMPTCSVYADEAIRLHGPVKGGKLAIKRICSCHPFTRLGGKSGFDPVPPHVK